MPVNWPKTDGLQTGPGDGTVPTFSARLDGTENITYPVDHPSLVAAAATDILNRLTGLTAQTPKNVRPSHYLFIRVHSPVTLKLTDLTGQTLGGASTDDLTAIPDSLYSGTDSAEQYAVIADPASSSYQLALQGTGNGQYVVDASLLTDQGNSQTENTGNIQIGQNIILTLKLNDQSLSFLPNQVASQVPTKLDPTPSPTVKAERSDEPTIISLPSVSPIDFSPMPKTPRPANQVKVNLASPGAKLKINQTKITPSPSNRFVGPTISPISQPAVKGAATKPLTQTNLTRRSLLLVYALASLSLICLLLLWQQGRD